MLQHRRNGALYLRDLGSAHGSAVNRQQVAPDAYIPLNVGDQLRFGSSTRTYVLCGGPEPSSEPAAHRAATATNKATPLEKATPTEAPVEERPVEKTRDPNEVFSGNAADFKAYLAAHKGKLKGLSATKAGFEREQRRRTPKDRLEFDHS